MGGGGDGGGGAATAPRGGARDEGAAPPPRASRNDKSSAAEAGAGTAGGLRGVAARGSTGAAATTEVGKGGAASAAAVPASERAGVPRPATAEAGPPAAAGGNGGRGAAEWLLGAPPARCASREPFGVESTGAATRLAPPPARRLRAESAVGSTAATAPALSEAVVAFREDMAARTRVGGGLLGLPAAARTAAPAPPTEPATLGRAATATPTVGAGPFARVPADAEAPLDVLT